MRAIYLHKNGKLIEKQEIVYKNDPAYFASPMVVSVWKDLSDDTSKEDWKLILTDAIIRGALPLEIKRVGLENGLKMSDIEKIWETRR
jgi:hypothetical protein